MCSNEMLPLRLTGRTSESTSDITPARPTAPNVGRSAVAPQRSAGAIRLPSVSVPIANGSVPAATAAAGPALDPEEPSAMFQGFLTMPPHHTSSKAISPVASLATSTAPALRRRSYAVALPGSTCSTSKSSACLRGPADVHLRK